MNRRTLVILLSAAAVVILVWAGALMLAVSPAQKAMRSLPSFGAHVATVLQGRFPQRRFGIEDEGATLRAGDRRLPVEPLYQEIEKAGARGDEIDKKILAHFEPILAPKPLPPMATPPWAQAQKDILPRLTGAGHARQSGLVGHELVPGIQVVYLLGHTQEALLLVTPDDLKVWGIDEPQLFEKALANLGAISRAPRLALPPPGPDPGVKGKWVGIAVRDGNDAARILLPDVRRQIAAVVGEPFFVGLSRPGFLIAWSRDFNRNKLFAEQIQGDFASRPPGIGISPEVFMATVKDGLRPATHAEAAAEAAIPQAPPPPPPPPQQAGETPPPGR